jgi:hypothetical protein
LKGAGLLDSRVPANFEVPTPHSMTELAADEDPLEDEFRAELAGEGEVEVTVEAAIVEFEARAEEAPETPAGPDEPAEDEAT